MTLTAALLAAVIGITLGLLGGGGAILAVPVFVYALGVPVKSAVPMSLLVIGAASALGAAQRWHAGHLRPARGLAFGLAAVLGAFVGARIGVLVPERVQLLVFATVVLAASVQMWRSAARAEGAPTRPSRVGAVVVPATIGVLTGIIGIGGGFLFVPALVTLHGIPMREATGLSLMVITMNAFAGFLGYVGHVAINWALVVPFTVIVAACTLVAGPLAARVDAPTLKRTFAVVLVSIGAFVLFENLR